jgi:allantoinase
VFRPDQLQGTSALILFHAELGSTADHPHSDPTNYSTFLDSRPESLETDALALILRLARRYPSLRFHIVHLSASSALPLIRRARSEDGVSNLTVETCFHYLSLSAADIPTNATAFKCCPPIRDDGNRQKLIDAVVDGTIDFVVSDHSPCIPELKAGDFMSAWGGVSGLGLGLSLMTTTIGDRVGLSRITELLGSRQAKQVGLQGKKGELKKGLDADLVVFDPTETRTVSLVSQSVGSPRASSAWDPPLSRFKHSHSLSGRSPLQKQSLPVPRQGAPRVGQADIPPRPTHLGRTVTLVLASRHPPLSR